MAYHSKYTPQSDPLTTMHPPHLRKNHHPIHKTASMSSVIQKNQRISVTCCLLWSVGILFVIVLLVYLLAPIRTNILLLGIDHSPSKSYLGRSDTIILVTFIPLKPYIGMLSIPRDLWVNIPGIGENRINTAHFYAETQIPGSGPRSTMDTIQQNFNIQVYYYVRIRFEDVKDIVDAMGGVNVNLPEPMAGYPAGILHLNGNKALAFARNRQGTDDFFRMEHGQLLIKAIIEQLKKPSSLLVMPKVAIAIYHSIDTNLPVWQLPRLIVAIIRSGINGIDNLIISREMATPYQTPQGASVLLPKWEMINQITKDIFGQ